MVTVTLEIDIDDVDAVAEVLVEHDRTARYANTLSHAKYKLLLEAQQLVNELAHNKEEQSHSVVTHAIAASKEIGILAHFQGLKHRKIMRKIA